MQKQDLILYINENILKDYNIQVASFERKEEKTMAFYSLANRTIHINLHNKAIFNDYFAFIETMLHENVHAINHRLGFDDVEHIGELQEHNLHFRERFLEVYGLHCDNSSHTGSVDFKQNRNREGFEKLILNKIKHKKYFEFARKTFLENIYEEPQRTIENYIDNGGQYSLNDDGGINI